VLEQHVDGRAHDRQAAGRQAAHGVAPLDVFDLDDLGAPVGEERRRRGHERVLGDLEDADALHDCGHGPSGGWHSDPTLGDARMPFLCAATAFS
jgi:hypothetical protein